MTKRDNRDNELEAEQRPKKKSKTKKHTKDTRDKSASDNVAAQPNLKRDASYIQSSLLNEVPQHEIDQFLTENSIRITDTSSGNTAALRPIISFAHLPPCDKNLYENLSSFK